MPLTSKSNNVQKPIALMDDLTKVTLWTRKDEPVGSLPVPEVTIMRTSGRVAWLHVGQNVTKAMTKDSSVWLGSLWGDYIPAFNIYNYPVRSGYVSITRDSNNSAQANIQFTPITNIAVGSALFIDLMYITNS